MSSLLTLPVSTRLIKQAHSLLLEGARGTGKLPGEFRSSQNWIGGATLHDAVFIPPHHQEISNLMSDLENFLNNTEIHVPHLIKIAIAHYQFETIHPFLDGNGRVGRLLITLYLVANGLLSKPTLYLSDFFERNRQLYYDNLTLVRTHNDLSQWIKFFLAGVIETASHGVEVFQKILQLRNEIEEKKLLSLGRKLTNAKAALNYFYRYPVFTAAYLAEELQISMPTANTVIRDFIRLNIIKEVSGNKRNRMYVFEEYLKLFRR